MNRPSETLNWASLELPHELPPLEVLPRHAHVFMFSAVTWNRHQIHYCDESARSEGHEGVVVQRALLGNYLSNLLTYWAGEAGEIRRLEWKVKKSALPDRKLRCSGRAIRMLSDAERRTVECEIRISDEDGAEVVVGRALVAELPGA